jgi:hypothetical protein
VQCRASAIEHRLARLAVAPELGFDIGHQPVHGGTLPLDCLIDESPLAAFDQFLLRLAQLGRGIEEPLRVAALASDRPVDRPRGAGRLLELADPLGRRGVAGSLQLARELVSRRGELVERQAI